MNVTNPTWRSTQSLTELKVICTRAGQWAKPTCSHAVLLEFGGTIQGRSTPKTSTPPCNATSLTVRLHVQQQHTVCRFTDTKRQLTNNSRDTNLCSQTADIRCRENLNLTQCTAVVFSPVLHGAPIRPMSQSIKLIQSILQTPISIIHLCTNKIALKFTLLKQHIKMIVLF
jgi:hypothetical protein